MTLYIIQGEPALHIKLRIFFESRGYMSDPAAKSNRPVWYNQAAQSVDSRLGIERSPDQRSGIVPGPALFAVPSRCKSRLPGTVRQIPGRAGLIARKTAVAGFSAGICAPFLRGNPVSEHPYRSESGGCAQIQRRSTRGQPASHGYHDLHQYLPLGNSIPHWRSEGA